MKTRLTVEHLRASWSVCIGDVRPQPMDWGAPPLPGFKSRSPLASAMLSGASRWASLDLRCSARRYG
eukprot:4905622-Alexandrium_andersonii.AAC.1